MFDIGFGEMLLLAAIALIAIGPKQLPEVARTIGRLLNEFRRATGDLTKNFTEARNYTDEVRANAIAPTPHPEPPAAAPASADSPQAVAEEQMSFAMTEAENKKVENKKGG